MNVEKAIIKGGSAVFEGPGGAGSDLDNITMFGEWHQELRESGLVTLQVASGLVSEGREYCIERGVDHTSLSLLQLGRRGMAGQITSWSRGVEPLGLEVVPFYVTHEEMDHQTEGKIIMDELEGELAREKSLVVMNESPASGKVEIEVYEWGEMGGNTADANNDWLTVHAAIKLGAKYVFLLSNDVDGFMRDDRVVETISVPEIEALLAEHDNGSSRPGTGGVRDKLWAAARGVMAMPDCEIIFGNAHKSPRDMMLGNCACTRVVQCP